MKKICYLLIALLCTHIGYSQSCVSVWQVAANYKTKQVTFDLKWTTCSGSHNYRTWVIVDYRTVNTDGSKGAWTRATISASSAGTLVSASKGVLVTGSANGTQRVTFTLSEVPAGYEWCATAFDYPPQAVMANGTYTLKGTSPFTVNESTALGAGVHYYTGACVTAITDATNNPEGIVTNPAFTAGAIATTGQTLCTGSAYTTIGSTTAAGGGDGRITYQWLRNGTVISNSNNATYVPTQAGTYNRQAKDGTCNTSWVTSSGSWAVTEVNIPAAPSITGRTVIGQGETAVSFSSSSVVNATSYVWMVPSGASISNGENTNSILVNFASDATSGNITVAGVNAICTGTSSSLYITLKTPPPGADVYAGCDIWVRNTYTGRSTYSNATCTALGEGWRQPTAIELSCACLNKAKLSNWIPPVYYDCVTGEAAGSAYWTSTQGAESYQNKAVHLNKNPEGCLVGNADRSFWCMPSRCVMNIN